MNKALAFALLLVATPAAAQLTMPYNQPAMPYQQQQQQQRPLYPMPQLTPPPQMQMQPMPVPRQQTCFTSCAPYGGSCITSCN
jgi:hypothetical protein